MRVFVILLNLFLCIANGSLLQASSEEHFLEYDDWVYSDKNDPDIGRSKFNHLFRYRVETVLFQFIISVQIYREGAWIPFCSIQEKSRPQGWQRTTRRDLNFITIKLYPFRSIFAVAIEAENGQVLIYSERTGGTLRRDMYNFSTERWGSESLDSLQPLGVFYGNPDGTISTMCGSCPKFIAFSKENVDLHRKQNLLSSFFPRYLLLSPFLDYN